MLLCMSQIPYSMGNAFPEDAAVLQTASAINNSRLCLSLLTGTPYLAVAFASFNSRADPLHIPSATQAG